MNRLLHFILFFFIAVTVMASDRPKFDRAAYEKEQHQFVIREARLTKEEAKAFFSILRISIFSLFLTILQYFCTIKSSNQMCISDWLRRTFLAFCQYLFAKIYIISIKIVTGSFSHPVTILLFLSLMTLGYGRCFFFPACTG